MGTVQVEIEASLNQLRRLIEEAVKQERDTDQLTMLGNNAALNEELRDALDEEGRLFWIAFVEVDYFKRINDEYGYEQADALLMTVANHLAMCDDYLAEGARAFRAHGDEFFLVGYVDRDVIDEWAIQSALDQVCSSISKIRLKVQGKEKPMSCTVSIGWATSLDGRSDEHGRDPRAIRLYTEAAVADAKSKGRNTVVKYQAGMRQSSAQELRDKCSACKTSFTAAIPKDHYRPGSMFCPNCGGNVGDKPSLTIPQAPQQIQPVIQA